MSAFAENPADQTLTLSCPRKPPRHNKRPTCLGEPDVTVVVGGTVFHEHSKFLCCWSGYFEAAFRSGMRESSTRRFEFPDRDPDEWDWILSLLIPFATAQLTLEKLEVALGWFDFLCVTRGLEQCDQVLHDAVLRVPLRSEDGFSTYLEYLSTAQQYNLPRSKAQYFQIIRAVFNRAPVYLNQEHLDTMALLILSHEECRKELWGLLEKYLPASIGDKVQQDCLLHTGALQALVMTEIQKIHLNKELRERNLQVSSLEHQMDVMKEQSDSTTNQLHSTRRRLSTKNTQLRRMVAIMEHSPTTQTVSKLKRQLKSDSICGHALPMRWSRKEEEEDEEYLTGITASSSPRKKRKLTERESSTTLSMEAAASMILADDSSSVLFGMSSDEDSDSD